MTPPLPTTPAPLTPLPFNPHPLDSTKDIRGHPLFRGGISRGLWRLLTHRLTRPGRWFSGMTIAFALYGATSLDLQVFVPFTYVLGVWLLAWGWALGRAPRIAVSARFPARVQAGTTWTAHVTVQAVQKTVFDAVLLPRRLPPAVDAVRTEGTRLGDLRAGESHTADMALRCTRRGRHTLHGFRVQTDFPFGLLRAYTPAPDRQMVLATPQWTPLRSLTLPPRRSDQPGGAALATTRGEATEFIGNREFREGDNIRDMDWRASARLDRWVVREFHEEYLRRVALVLDTSVPGADEAAEGAVSLCAAVSEALARQEYAVCCLLAGPTLHEFGSMPAWACHEQTENILAVVEMQASAALDARTPGLVEQMAQASAAIVILLDWDDARRAFVESLRAQDVALRLVIVADGPLSQNPAADAARFGPILQVTPEQIMRGLDGL